MLKKISSILLTILYLASNTGFAINLDYVEHIISDEKVSDCDLDIHNENDNFSLNAYSYERFLTQKTTSALKTISDFVSIGAKHHHDESSESEFVVLITNKDIISNNTSSKLASVHIPLENNYAHIIEQMNHHLDSKLDIFNEFPTITTHYKQPLYVVFQQLVFYS